MTTRLRGAAALTLAFGAALVLAGCAPRTADERAAGAWALADSEFLPAVGTHPQLRFDVFYAPGAQSACAWLPDGALWNGDFEFTLGPARFGAGRDSSPASENPSRSRALSISNPWGFSPNPGGPHRALPAARRGVSTKEGMLEGRAFMPWRGSDRDTAGWTRLSIRVLPAPGAVVPSEVSISFRVRSGGGPGYPLHPDAAIADRFDYAFANGRLVRDGRTILVVAPARGSRAGPARAIRDRTHAAGVEATGYWPAFEIDLLDDGPVAWDVWIAPVGGVASDVRPPDHGDTFEQSLARTAEAWQAEMAKGATIVHPDPRVQATLVSAQRLLIGTRERRHGTLRFLGNPMQYRDLYLRDGVRVVRALALLGRADLAADALGGLYRFQWPGGAFLSQRGQLDGTGQALWGLRQLQALGGERAIVEALVEPALRGARWLALQRESSQMRGGPAAGLLPYSDPRDNELARGHLLGTDGWGIAGAEALAATLRDLGRVAEAETLAADARAHRATLLATWDRETRRQGRPLPPVLEGGGRDWGNLAAAWPCGVFAADDSRFLALDRWFRATHFSAGLPTYGSRDSVHHYVGIDLARAALERGDRRTAAADLQALVDHAQPDGSGFELRALDGGFGDNLPPHGTFAALFVDLVCAGLIRERGDSLVVFSGIAEGTFAGDGPIEARLVRAPTRFGPAAVALTRPAGAAAFKLETDLPAPAVVEWPPPTRVRTVRGTLEATLAADGRRFTLPAGKGSWTIDVEGAGATP